MALIEFEEKKVINAAINSPTATRLINEHF